MALDTGRIQVTRVIVHEIPKRLSDDAAGQPVLSDIVSELTPDLATYFREKVAGSLGLSAYSVVFDETHTSPVRELVSKSLAQGRSPNFVAMSQTIARHLHGCQTGVNPGGLLIVMAATVAQEPAIAILKLEKEEGVRVRQRTRQGKRAFDILHLRDLMLTERTRVFKVGLFTRGADGTVEGLLSDNQRGYSATTPVANFFLQQFLGCRLAEAPDVATKRFFEVTQAFINDNVDSPEKKARYQIALQAELSSQAESIRPIDFAMRSLDSADRAAYEGHLRERGLDAAVYEKDIALVKTQLPRLEMDFQSGIQVMAPPAAMEDHVSIGEGEAGQTRLEIRDTLRRVRGPLCANIHETPALPEITVEGGRMTKVEGDRDAGRGRRCGGAGA